VNIRLAPSILAADFAVLGDQIAAAERGGADYIHVDVMDGHFVPNLTVGPPLVRSAKRVARVPIDVHLMITDPDRYAEAFVEAGADLVSVHVEAQPHLNRTISFIKSLGAKAGVAVNPSTPAAALEEVAADVDFVLVMTVNPGFGGQAFLPRSTSKIRKLRAMLDGVGNPAPIEVDGGIDIGTVGEVVRAGAEILVAGSAIFHAPDVAAAARELRAAAERAAGAPSTARARRSGEGETDAR
jgi:ribulose-phosphate 3-epimerase